MIGRSILLAAALLLVPPHSISSSFAHARTDKENEIRRILEHIQKGTLKFRDEIERVYGERCNADTLSQCSRSSFNGCSSVFPNQQCMENDELVIEACAGEPGEKNEKDYGVCNALWDKTSSVVSIPSALAQGSMQNPTDPELLETACYSNMAEDFMVEKYEQDEMFWDNYGAQPSWTYYGAHNGLFRRVPAIYQETCGNYDPRRRPWFVAASSGPKDVIIVIDVSGSMSNHNRMALAKEAAITVVSTLTISDRVAVIVFSDDAYQIPLGTDTLYRATNENKKLLIESIQQLSEGGATNFHSGFQQAFDALERTIQQEYSTGCNIAILFMTDGVRTAGPDTNEVLQLISDSTEKLARYGRDTKIFTFSLGAQADRSVTKKIACSTGGIWTPVDDFDGDLVGVMSSYYKTFAMGLSNNTNFTAWIEPYEFFSAEKFGTTNSAPVFDRSVNPPLFLGVVASDVYLDAFEKVLEEDARSSTMLQRFVQLSTAQCPKIDLNECQLEALRYLGGGQEATCGQCDSYWYSGEYPGIIPAECPFKPDLPTNLWQNTDLEGVKYEDRACCQIGSSIPSDVCVYSNVDGARINMMVIAGSVAGLVLFCCFGWLIYKCFKSVLATKAPPNYTITLETAPPPVAAPIAPVSASVPAAPVALPVGTVISPPNASASAINTYRAGPASAPPMNPEFHA